MGPDEEPSQGTERISAGSWRVTAWKQVPHLNCQLEG